MLYIKHNIRIEQPTTTSKCVAVPRGHSRIDLLCSCSEGKCNHVFQRRPIRVAEAFWNNYLSWLFYGQIKKYTYTPYNNRMHVKEKGNIAMSATGPISNYYVDSLINHESEDVLASRFSATGPISSSSRPTSLVPECADYPSCSFAPKPPVFTTSWAPVHSQSSVVYHPYTHQPHLGTDSRYVRSWLEPIPGTVSFPGYAGNSRHYGLKPDTFQDPRAGDSLGSNGRAYTDYLYCSAVDIREKQPNTPSPETESLSSGKHKDDKAEIDPSKLKPFLFTTGYGMLLGLLYSLGGWLLAVVKPSSILFHPLCRTLPTQVYGAIHW